MEQGLPNIVGTVQIHGDSGPSIPFGVAKANGAFYVTNSSRTIGGNYSASSYTTDNTIRFSATNSNKIYGNSLKVQPQSLTTRYYMKY